MPERMGSRASAYMALALKEAEACSREQYLERVANAAFRVRLLRVSGKLKDAATACEDVLKKMGARKGFIRVSSLLREYAQRYVGPGTEFPPMPDPPEGFIIRVTPTKVRGFGPYKFGHLKKN